MSVAKSQIDELLSTIERYVAPEKVGPLLAELRSSQAAQRNKSFAETIWRLLERWAEKHARREGLCCPHDEREHETREYRGDKPRYCLHDDCACKRWIPRGETNIVRTLQEWERIIP